MGGGKEGIRGEVEEEGGKRGQLKEKLEKNKKKLQELVNRGERERAMAEKMADESKKRLEAERWLERGIWVLVVTAMVGFMWRG